MFLHGLARLISEVDPPCCGGSSPYSDVRVMKDAYNRTALRFRPWLGAPHGLAEPHLTVMDLAGTGVRLICLETLISRPARIAHLAILV